MIHMQVIAKDNSNLHSLVRAAIHEGKIKSFEIVRVRGGLKIQHRKFLGSVSLAKKPGLLLATLRCHAKRREWQLLDAFIGRMTYHFREKIAAINIQFD